MIRYTMLAFWAVAIVSGTFVFGQQPPQSHQSEHTQEPPATAEQIAHDATILIPLPVFIASIIGTAALTWKVAKYDSAKDREIEQLKAAVKALQNRDKGSNQ